MIKLVPAICPSCGGQLELDDNMKRAECKYCKNTIIVDEAIEKFKTDSKGGLKISGIKNLDQHIEEANKYFKVGKYNEAIAACHKVFKLDPFNENAIIVKTKSLLEQWNHIKNNEKKLNYGNPEALAIARSIKVNYEDLLSIVHANESEDEVYNKIGLDNINHCEYIISKLEKSNNRFNKMEKGVFILLIILVLVPLIIAIVLSLK